MTKQRWGFDLTWADTKLYSARMLVIKEGQETPYIYHKHQDLTLFVLQGTANITIDGKCKLLNEQQSIHILPKMMFKVAAIKGDVTILEAATKIEDDIIIVKE